MTTQMAIFCLTLTILTSRVAVAITQNPEYLDNLEQAPTGTLFIDTRPLTECIQRTIKAAHCLPADDLHGASGELPSFADIFWALGTAGISADRNVVIIGDHTLRRDYVAGLLYLSGQHQVQILTIPLHSVLKQSVLPTGPGQSRGNLRQTIYRATMRDEQIRLPTEIVGKEDSSHMVLVDGSRLIHKETGRSASTQIANEHESEIQLNTKYIPGGVKLPDFNLKHVQPNSFSPKADSQASYINTTKLQGHPTYVVYADNAMNSIALFTRLAATKQNHNMTIQVLSGGWRGWHDYYRQTHPTRTHKPSTDGTARSHTFQYYMNFLAIFIVIAGAALVIINFILKKGEKQWT